MEQAWIITVVLGLLLQIIAFAFLLPGWALLDCLNTPLLSKKQRYGWAAAMIVLWAPAAHLYALWPGRSRYLRWAAVLNLSILVLALTNLMSAVAMEKRKYQERDQINWTLLRRVQFPGTTPVQSEQARHDLAKDLITLREELEATGPLKRRPDDVEVLTSALRDMLMTGSISPDQRALWRDSFEQRKALPLDELFRRRLKMNDPYDDNAWRQGYRP